MSQLIKWAEMTTKNSTGGEQDYLFSLFFCHFVLLNFGPNTDGRSYSPAGVFTGLRTMDNRKWAAELAFGFQRPSQAELKVKAGGSVGGSCERAAKGRVSGRGNSGAAVSDNSFSEARKHMRSDSGMQTQTKTHSRAHKTEHEGNGQVVNPSLNQRAESHRATPCLLKRRAFMASCVI